MNRELRKIANGKVENPGEISTKQRFVIQEHHASRLHFDFRLEMFDSETGQNTLVSWAIPKNLSTIPGVKHLAIRVENHDLSYIDFEGEIAEGNYGAGNVNIWDKGKWGLMKGSLSEGSLSFNLLGEKNKGRYQMILTEGFARSKNKDNKEEKKWKHWLIWKRDAGMFL